MGGHDKVLAAAAKAYAGGDNQWTAELATCLIRINPNDKEARKLKANVFRKLSYAQR